MTLQSSSAISGFHYWNGESKVDRGMKAISIFWLRVNVKRFQYVECVALISLYVFMLSRTGVQPSSAFYVWRISDREFLLGRNPNNATLIYFLYYCTKHLPKVIAQGVVRTSDCSGITKASPLDNISIDSGGACPERCYMARSSSAITLFFVLSYWERTLWRTLQSGLRGPIAPIAPLSSRMPWCERTPPVQPYSWLLKGWWWRVRYELSVWDQFYGRKSVRYIEPPSQRRTRRNVLICQWLWGPVLASNVWTKGDNPTRSSGRVWYKCGERNKHYKCVVVVMM